MKTADGKKLPDELRAADFAELSGWGRSKAAVRRARKWLLRTGIGYQPRRGAHVFWDIENLRHCAPSVMHRWVSRGTVVHEE